MTLPSLTQTMSIVPAVVRGAIKRVLQPPKNYQLYGFSTRLTTKFLGHALISMLAVNVGVGLWHGIYLDCRGIETQERIEKAGTKLDEKANEDCWNEGLYVVEQGFYGKGLRFATKPGVIPDILGEDKQTLLYYNSQAIFLPILAFLCYATGWFLETPVLDTIKRILELENTDGIPRVQLMVSYFLEANGFNFWFGINYLLCQLWVVFLCVIQFTVVMYFIGPDFLTYGTDVIFYFVTPTTPVEPWIKLFPLRAKCKEVGMSGGSEDRFYDCKTPLNNSSAKTYFFYYWLVATCFTLAALSLLRKLFYLFVKPARNASLRNLAYLLLPKEIEIARTYKIRDRKGVESIKQKDKSTVVYVNISFSEFLVLEIMEMNMKPDDYRQFLRQLLVTKNAVFQVRPITTSKCKVSKSCGKGVLPGDRCNFETIIDISPPENLLEIAAESSIEILEPVDFNREFMAPDTADVVVGEKAVVDDTAIVLALQRIMRKTIPDISFGKKKSNAD